MTTILWLLLAAGLIRQGARIARERKRKREARAEEARRLAILESERQAVYLKCERQRKAIEEADRRKRERIAEADRKERERQEEAHRKALEAEKKKIEKREKLEQAASLAEIDIEELEPLLSRQEREYNEAKDKVNLFESAGFPASAKDHEDLEKKSKAYHRTLKKYIKAQNAIEAYNSFA